MGACFSNSRSDMKLDADIVPYDHKMQQQLRENVKGARRTITVLLCVANDHACLTHLRSAADSLGLMAFVETVLAKAVECFTQYNHDIVLVDCCAPSIDHQTLISQICKLAPKSLSCKVALVTQRRYSSERGLYMELNEGFDRVVAMPTEFAGCMNLLSELALNDCGQQSRLLMARSLFEALDNITEPLKIVSYTHKIQYVNPAYERLVGFSVDELVGKSMEDVPRSAINSDWTPIIESHISNNQKWRGICRLQQKSGATLEAACRVIPVNTQGFLSHMIFIYQALNAPVARNGSFRLQPDAVTVQTTISTTTIQSRSDSDSQVTVPLNLHLVRSYITSMLSMPGQSNAVYIQLDRILRILNTVEIQTASSSQESDEPPTIPLFSSSAARMSHMDADSSRRGASGSNRMIIRRASEGPELLQSLNEERRSWMTWRDRGPRSNSSSSANSFAAPPDATNDVDDDDITQSFIAGLITHSRLRAPTLRPGLRTRCSTASLQTAAYARIQEVPPRDVLDALRDSLQWHFDVLNLERLTENRPLLYLGVKMLRIFHVDEVLGVSDQVLRNWLAAMEGKYRPNYYHNATHAADVLQCTAYLLSGERIKKCATDISTCAVLLAAVIHDLDHPGRTNPFQVNASTSLAVMYNDRSVLENHHLAMAFKVTLADEKTNIFANLDRDTYKILREYIIDLVLATDMSKHFDLVKQFRIDILSQQQFTESPDVVRLEVPTDMASGGGHGVGAVAGVAMEPAVGMSDEQLVLILKMLIKCADISNPCRPQHICQEWATRIAEEYFQQTADEKLRGLPVAMANFDRTTCHLPQTQTGFINLFALDLFQTWHNFSPIPLLLQHLEQNYAFWNNQEAMHRRGSAQSCRDQNPHDVGPRILRDQTPLDTPPKTCSLAVPNIN